VETNTSLKGLTDFFRAQYDTNTTQTNASTDVTALSEVQMREVLQTLADFNAGLAISLDDFGATAISLPKLTSAGDMGALSTADLLQLIRAEARKTTELLVMTTMESIAAQEKTIEANKASTDAKLQEAADKMAEAEKLMAVLNVVKWAVYALGFIAAAFTGGAAGIAIAAFSAVMIALSEIPVNDKDQSIIASGTDAMSKSLTKDFNGNEEKGSDWANGIMVGLQVTLSIAVIAMTLGMAAPGVASAGTSQAGASAGKAISEATEVAAAQAAKVAGDSARAAGQTAQQVAAAEAIAATKVFMAEVHTVVDGAIKVGAEQAGKQVLIELYSKAISTIARVLQGFGLISQAGTSIAVAKANQDADLANADVTELKAMLDFLQSILESESEFIQMILALSAQLDAGVASVVNSEFQANENRTQEMFS
jgi:hypothetical protein